MGYTFENVSTNLKMKDPSGNTYAEVDIVLENGDYVMLIEVKTDLKTEHVKEHAKRMETIRRAGRKWPDKKLLGAVSAAISGRQGAGICEEERLFCDKPGRRNHEDRCAGGQILG
jgi:hypothetical protein